MTPGIRKIISGGQTGVDRAALDIALENGIKISGYVPKGRLAEDGRIPDKYPNLIETDTDDPAERTELNVIHSNATLIISHGDLSGGSKLTAEFAAKHKRPFLHIDLSSIGVNKAIEKTKEWLSSIECDTLNIAGPRASEDKEIYQKAGQFLKLLFRRDLHA